MASFFSKLKGSTGPSVPVSGTPPTKRDANAPQPTPLEKLLADAGPIRADGSDKFFGFENFGSTCYCNSIIQCLYYSVPFREQVINFPIRSPAESLIRPSSSLPRLNTDVTASTEGQNGALSPTNKGGKTPFVAATQPVGRRPPAIVGPPAGPGVRPEENKDSPEYKKKLAMAAGPVLNMEYENSPSYGMTESLFTALKDIFEAIIAHESRIGVVSPNKFLEILRRENEMFRTAMHQDAHEFLNLLLNEVVENVEQFEKKKALQAPAHLNETRETGSIVPPTIIPPTTTAAATKISNSTIGWVHELFEGTLTSETRCLTCENISQRDEAFLDLSVDLDQHSSVTSCLRKFSEEEMLCERNKFHCDNCGGLQEAEKRMKIKRLPRILALHLKRFKYTEDLQRLQKLFHRVVYPYYLRLFNTTDDAEDPDRLYELYAVVVHIGGGPYHGHYVSIIKTQDRGWLLFDDEMVEPVDKSYVRNFFGGENVLACAYVLFYQETTLEAMQREQEAEALADAAKQAAEAGREGVPIEIKTNGVLNGMHTTNPLTPTGEDADQLVSLDHVPTSPVVPATAKDTVLSPTLTSPPKPVLSPKKSRGNLNFIKISREEKERRAAEKAAEKELERQAKQQRKEAEAKRRENYKKQDEEMRAAIAASIATKADEDKRATTEQQEGPPATSKENGHSSGIMGGSLNRLSSMSIRHKGKFWQQKDKHEPEPHTPTTSDPSMPIPEMQRSHTTPAHATPDKEKKNRFSLGRKKSNMLH